MTTVIGILLIIMAVFLVISVLMQSSKDHRLSGSIAGGAETFFGKTKGKSMDAMFNKLTTVISIIFVVLVVALYVVQPENTETLPAADDDAAQEEVVDNAETETETEAEAEVETEVADDNVAEETPAEDETVTDDETVVDETADETVTE